MGSLNQKITDLDNIYSFNSQNMPASEIISQEALKFMKGDEELKPKKPFWPSKMKNKSITTFDIRKNSMTQISS
jgi:hypothetical protein